MKTTSRRRGAYGVPSVHSWARSRIAARISLRAWELTERFFHSSFTRPATPSGPAATVATAPSARKRARCSVTRCRPRRSTRRSKRIRTDLISPSRASVPVEVQALYQTVWTSGRAPSSVSTSRIRLLLPMPQPASTASVKGVELRDAASRAASRSAAPPAPSRSAPGSATGSSLSRANCPRPAPVGSCTARPRRCRGRSVPPATGRPGRTVRRARHIRRQRTPASVRRTGDPRAGAARPAAVPRPEAGWQSSQDGPGPTTARP